MCSSCHCVNLILIEVCRGRRHRERAGYEYPGTVRSVSLEGGIEQAVRPVAGVRDAHEATLVCDTV